jgi:acyl carrier protein
LPGEAGAAKREHCLRPGRQRADRADSGTLRPGAQQAISQIQPHAYIIADCAKIDRALLVPSATMESLGIPSLDMVDILFEIEEKFDVYVPMGEEMGNIVYLADFVTMLADLIRNGSTPPETA